MALEGLLLEKGEGQSVAARLAEACTYRLAGEDPSRRSDLRKLVKRLYDRRSQFVHTGAVDAGARREAVDLARQVLARELLALEQTTGWMECKQSWAPFIEAGYRDAHHRTPPERR
jgi:hypothetical protein